MSTSSAPTLYVKPALEILKAILAIANGLVAFIILSLEEPPIFAILPTDRLQALYSLIHHGILDASFLYAAWCFMTAALARKATLRDLGLVTFSPRRLVWLIPGLALILIGQIAWVDLLSALNVPLAVDNWNLPTLYTQMPISFAILALILCVVAPLSEEILFRGVLFRWLTTKCPLVLAVLLSAFMFAILHLSIVSLGSTFLLGVANALLVRHTGSVWPGILLHATNNALFILIVIPH